MNFLVFFHRIERAYLISSVGALFIIVIIDLLRPCGFLFFKVRGNK